MNELIKLWAAMTVQFIAARSLGWILKNALQIFRNLRGELRGVFDALYEFALFVDDVE